MRELQSFCRTATIFKSSGEIDEPGMREFLARFSDSRIGIYLASGGSGEGHALEWGELRRVYEIGVSECRGKVVVCANPPEQFTAKATIEHTRLAIEAGVDIVNLYGPAGWHGYKPTPEELASYFDAILSVIKHPVAITPNPIIGYTPDPTTVAALCRKYPQIVAINLSGNGDAYFLELAGRLDREVVLNVPVTGSAQLFSLGAKGILGAEANVLPITFRRFLDAHQAGGLEEAARPYSDIIRFARYVGKLGALPIRGLKAAMRVLRLPGGEGVLRSPYRLPIGAELEKFRAGLMDLHIQEIDEMAGAAGIP